MSTSLGDVYDARGDIHDDHSADPDTQGGDVQDALDGEGHDVQGGDVRDTHGGDVHDTQEGDVHHAQGGVVHEVQEGSP